MALVDELILGKPSMDPFEKLTLASEFPAPFTWAFEGVCRVEHDGAVWERKIAASWNDSGSGMLDDADHAIWEIAMRGRLGDRAPTITVAALDGTWSIPHVHPETRNSEGQTRLLWHRMWHRTSEAPIAATVFYLPNSPPIIYPDHLPVVEGVFGRSTGENALRTTLFAREALLRSMEIGSIRYLVVAYDGEPFDEDCLVSHLTVLSFVLGRELDVRAQVSVDANGKMVERRLWTPVAPLEQKARPAIQFLVPTNTAALGMFLGTMVERARRWRFDENAPIDVAVKYLLRWNGEQLDLEIRDITSALNVVIESPAFGAKHEPVVDKKVFKPVWKHMKTVIKALPNDVPQRLRDRLCERIKEANDVTASEHRRRFWKAVRFKPTKTERLALERRHVMAHAGFIDTEDSAKERALYDDIRITRTIANESFLALLGYDGLMIDYTQDPDRALRGRQS